jgi:hypothetical protein
VTVAPQDLIKSNKKQDGKEFGVDRNKMFLVMAVCTETEQKHRFDAITRKTNWDEETLRAEQK